MWNTSYEQTALLYRPTSHLEFSTILRRPVPPPELVEILETGTPVAMQRYLDDAVIQWWPNGLVKVVQTDGAEQHFWRKPALGDAVKYRSWWSEMSRGFFKFNSDGSVDAHCFEANYHWGADIREAAPEEGAIMTSQQDMEGDWSFFLDEGEDEGEDDENDWGARCYCQVRSSDANN
jgi:hypothetical protein